MSAVSVQEAVDRLEQIASAVRVPYPHWLGGGEADQGPSYCHECAMKAVNADRGEFVDGGWSQDNDGCCHCHDCRRLLDYTLTDYGVSEELDHFRSTRLRGALDAETAYHLARLLEHYSEHPEVKAILPKVRRALARTEHPTSHGAGVSDE
ncbi:hypothetical protein ABB27_02595 [Stenotrophomonas terrae]|uniref:Uncharacterized protein n=1 Tax=Stenotrophomonas terrae TaxID=405446 RepID=A0A0R0CP89_9GAMM|nr:hypothetical protein [Stenotrophomonas terrae]KRG71789.1 hypothetical protein ABB27_02595 [Stenotrophomonas terrae]